VDFDWLEQPPDYFLNKMFLQRISFMVILTLTYSVVANELIVFMAKAKQIVNNEIMLRGKSHFPFAQIHDLLTNSREPAGSITYFMKFLEPLSKFTQYPLDESKLLTIEERQKLFKMLSIAVADNANIREYYIKAISVILYAHDLSNLFAKPGGYELFIKIFDQQPPGRINLKEFCDGLGFIDIHNKNNGAEECVRFGLDLYSRRYQNSIPIIREIQLWRYCDKFFTRVIFLHARVLWSKYFSENKARLV
jgi:hypothetical protein